MLASKLFVADDQWKFATLTGDYNPIHMDPIAARRTAAGAPVVHGVHTLLWLLENIGTHHPEISGVASVKARFSKMVYVGDRVDVRVTELSPTSLRAQACVEGVEVVSVVAGLGSDLPATSQLSPARPAELLMRQREPANLALHEMEHYSGRVAFASEPAEMAKAFPSAARLLGPSRVAALGCATYLVGMVVPGLYSLFGSLELRFTAETAPISELQFSVTSVDPRFRRVQLSVMGGGLAGSLCAFARVPPVPQLPMAAIAEHIARGEFADSTALVVGGSRGLGELTAKLIAAGGGNVIITYARGKSDAEKVAAEINDWGGSCDVALYDVRREAGQQLEALKRTPTHLYYFATPTISRRKSGFFAADRFAEFNEFYVRGFLRLVEACMWRAPAGIAVFYPSSIFVEERPKDMTEYAMSKAAGEILCTDMARDLKIVRVLSARLPPLPTDQTASMIQVDRANPVSVMLPIVRTMHGRADLGGGLNSA